MARWLGAGRGDWCDLGLDRTDCYSSGQSDPRTQRRSMRPVSEIETSGSLLRSPGFLGSDLLIVHLLEAYTKMSTELLRTFRVMASTSCSQAYSADPLEAICPIVSEDERSSSWSRECWLAGNNPVRVSQPIELWFLIPSSDS